MKLAPSTAVVVRQPTAFKVMNMMGARRMPQMAEQTHGDIGDARLQVIFANILEIEVAVETREPASESNEHLGQGRVHVHEELALDVLGSEAAKAREGERSLR